MIHIHTQFICHTVLTHLIITHTHTHTQITPHTYTKQSLGRTRDWLRLILHHPQQERSHHETSSRRSGCYSMGFTRTASNHVQRHESIVFAMVPYHCSKVVLGSTRLVVQLEGMHDDKQLRRFHKHSSLWSTKGASRWCWKGWTHVWVSTPF